MQVATRISYSEPASGTKARGSVSRSPVEDAILIARTGDRGGGQRGTLARGSRQPVNDRSVERSPDKEVFVARALSSTLAMLQMSAISGEASFPAADPDSAGSGQASTRSSFLDDLFSGVLSQSKNQ